MTASFDLGLLGGACVLESANGARIALPTLRWTGQPTHADEMLLARCAGPTLDIGCGPGRLTAELTQRGVPAMGIDVSKTAVRLTRERGGVAIRRSVFDRIPGEGRWRHAILADGNVGIGGDPPALLRRVFQLLAPGGRALIELEPHGTMRRDRVRVGDGTWFPWAWLGVDALDDIARAASLRIAWSAAHGARRFTELVAA
ncbi:class I SAM-dependent methyltransferase [Amycolatopsis sp. K13G38]|uniref:Class I SAM-dependent methyltransferase n=1 Tax=Amycolatopsis acididurans TaxID=2724524 RepID=A0ABX1JF49_9PSEU|nr:class I SAM-dependent methyltransferase [Amycolatopsis acididurans]NKQ58423.1 class I SAM-dependent methyltransferase [Amycolatopsis acididurans]